MAEMSKAELLQGTLDMLILKTLSRGAMHGYGVAESIAPRLSVFRISMSSVPCSSS